MYIIFFEDNIKWFLFRDRGGRQRDRDGKEGGRDGKKPLKYIVIYALVVFSLTLNIQNAMF